MFKHYFFSIVYGKNRTIVKRPQRVEEIYGWHFSGSNAIISAFYLHIVLICLSLHNLMWITEMRKRFAHGRLKGNRSENPGQSRCCVPPLLLNLDKKPLHCCREGVHVSGGESEDLPLREEKFWITLNCTEWIFWSSMLRGGRWKIEDVGQHYINF